MKWLPFDKTMAWHLAQHATRGLTIGSKFLPHSSWAPHCPSSYLLISDLYAELEGVQPMLNHPHWIVSRQMDTPLGYDAIIKKKDALGKKMALYDLVRYLGTAYEFHYQVAMLPLHRSLPLTSTIHLIGGEYQEGWGGIHTLIPGTLTPMFPAIKQHEDYFNFCTDFWQNHVFLADAQELYNAVRQNLKKLNPCFSSSELDGVMQEIDPELCRSAKEVLLRKMIEEEQPPPPQIKKEHLTALRHNLKRLPLS